MFFSLAYLIVPNLPLALSGKILGTTPHGYINLEYLTIALLCLVFPRRVIFGLLVLDLLADFTYSICFTYQFTFDNLVSSLPYLHLLPKQRLLEGTAFLGLGICVCAAMAMVRPRREERQLATRTVLACIVLLAPIDIIGGQNPVFHQDVARLPWRLTRSPMITLGVREAAARIAKRDADLAQDAPMPSASSRAISFLDANQSWLKNPDVVLIVVESWGLPLDRQLAQAVTSPFDNPGIAARYKVTYGAVPFSGLTLQGEARELCHSTIGFGILHSPRGLVERCLPSYFHNRNYEDISIHGYTGQMYYRSEWYPAFGFDQTWFDRDLRKAGLPNCRGAFPGICDASIADWMGRTLLTGDRDRPRFVYWVTLNSHLPLPTNPDLPDDGVCATHPALQDSAALCSWFRIVRAVHLSVKQLALGANTRPTVFVLVGDHAPPFADPKLKASFSNTEVPYLMLTPESRIWLNSTGAAQK